ncbi:MAG: hypothetical protein LC104_16950 [Bacteroidales bacterium]|nr:hypothetical protein [Bacteroidales bacterium]
MRSLTTLLAACVLGSSPGLSGEMPPPDPVRVIVVVVFASEGKAFVDAKLAPLAEEVQKREPKWNHFRLAASLQKSIPPGRSHTFTLPDKQSLKVTVERARDQEQKICLTIEPPGTGEVTYACLCSKFVPIVTAYTTKTGERMILAIMAKPCADATP